MSTYLLRIFVLIGILVSCQKLSTTDSGSHKEEVAGLSQSEHHRKGVVEVHFSPQQVALLKIRTQPLQKREMGGGIKCNGYVHLPPKGKAKVHSLISGQIHSIYVITGSYVRKGQILAMMESPEFLKLQSDYLSLVAQLDQVEKDYQRKKQLYQDSLLDAKTYQQVEAQYRTLQAKIQAIENQFRIYHIQPNEWKKKGNGQLVPIIAPISGYVQRVNIHIGAFVDPGTLLFEIIDPSDLHLHLRVFERDLARVKEGQKVLFHVSSFPDTFFQATVYALGKSIDSATRTLQVHAEFHQNQLLLLPEMYVEALIITRTDSFYAVPEKALVQQGDQTYIWLQEDAVSDSLLSFIQIPVRVEVQEGGMVGFTPLMPLPSEPKVVISGVPYLQAEWESHFVEFEH